MKSPGNIARYLLIVTLGLSACSSVAFGQTSSNRWSGNGPYGGAIRWFAIAQAIQAATRASVTEPTGQQVSRAVANGRIAFVSTIFFGGSHIDTMNPDGSDRKQLMFSNQDLESDPVWSPDGTKIAFARYNINSKFAEIFVMNADGSDQRRLTQSGNDRSPTWSPDGTKIAFARYNINSPVEIFVMNADGSDQRAVASGFDEPAWSPDGLKLAVGDNGALGTYGIYLINVDGSNRTQITQPTDLGA